MKKTSLLPTSTAAALLAAAIMLASATASMNAQAQQTAPQAPPAALQTSPQANPAAPQAPPSSTPQEMAPGGWAMRDFPAPTNLQVLPKNLTGREVREIMETWAGSLGVHCDFCHAADPNKLGPNGRPRLNFADDAKPDKKIARIMYTMTQQINKDYISKAMDLDTDNMESPVTCGTCHRGHEMPEAFVVPREEHHGWQGGSGAPLPAGGTAPTP